MDINGAGCHIEIKTKPLRVCKVKKKKICGIRKKRAKNKIEDQQESVPLKRHWNQKTYPFFCCITLDFNS